MVPELLDEGSTEFLRVFYRSAFRTRGISHLH